MKNIYLDVAIVGAGAAGMAAAIEIKEKGFNCALFDREEFLGGILLQCIHNGFGLHVYKEELTGPEFSLKLESKVKEFKIPFYNSTTILSIEKKEDFELVASSAKHGIFKIYSKTIILAMGSRERNRGNIRIAGDRPSGVYTAGLAQRLINIDGYLPGKKVVIIGSGDIGLIMARRMVLSGATVEAVIEIQDKPAGLTRNIVQCIEDFNIPLYVSHASLRILGKDRVNAVEIAPIENGKINEKKSKIINCDTVLLSVGLVPENELSDKMGIKLNPITNGPIVDSSYMTSVEGVFACGNVLHIHDLVDDVVEEAKIVGKKCANYLSVGSIEKKEVDIKIGTNVRYVVPSKIKLGEENSISLRSLVSLDSAFFTIKNNSKELFKKKLNWIKPSEMINVKIPIETFSNELLSDDGFIEVSCCII